MRQTVSRLNAEMGVYSGKQRLVAGAQKAGLMAAGVMAECGGGGAEGQSGVFDEQLAHMANTAYGDPSLGAEGQEAAVSGAKKWIAQSVRLSDTVGEGKRLCNAELVAFVGALQRRGFHDHLSRGSTRRYSEPSVGRRLCTDRIRCQREHGDRRKIWQECSVLRRSPVKAVLSRSGIWRLSSQPVCISSEHWLVRSGWPSSLP